MFIEVRPERAGHTLFVSDFDARISLIAERGPNPAVRHMVGSSADAQPTSSTTTRSMFDGVVTKYS